MKNEELFEKAKEIHTANGGNTEETAKALYSNEGFGFEAVDVARALNGGLKLSDAKVASVLYSPFGCHLSAAATASVLHSPDGLYLNAAKTAKLLYSWDVCNLSAMDVACVLRSKNGLGLDSTEVARALYSNEGLGLDAAKVAHVLYPPDGSIFTYAEIVQSLRRWLNLSAEEIARTLKDFGLNKKQAIDILKIAGIKPEQSHAEKAISELQNNNESPNQGIK